MIVIKSLLIFLIVINLNAMQKDIIYVEDKNSNQVNLKDEFLNPNTKYYTLTLATIKTDKYNIIEFFKKFKLTNALAYKYGKNKEYIKIIAGVYKNGTQAQENIKNLSIELQENRPYSSKLFRHQNNFNLTKKEIIKTTINKSKKDLKKIDLIDKKNSIFIKDTKEAKELKKEFFNKDSNYYSIALGTVPLSQEALKNFFTTYGLEDKALAHVYGKNRDKVRIIYGLYKNRNEAESAIKRFDKKIRMNSPFSMKMDKFQSFYLKSFPNSLEKSAIVELKVNKKEEKEKVINTKLSDEMKIIKINDIPKKVFKEELTAKIIPSPILKKKPKKKPKKIIKKRVIKKQIPKQIPKKRIKEDENRSRFIKHSKLKDVYYIESEGNFNILNEVFLNDKSSFFTVDLGELKLDEISIEEYFIRNGMTNEALAYKYGKNSEYARIVYGAYETKNEANKAIEKINFVPIEKLRVSNIKNHQKLYKEFHKEAKNPKSLKEFKANDLSIKSDIVERNFIENSINQNPNDKIIIVENSERLKEEFFNKNSKLYTVTLLTFLKKDISPEDFFSMYNLTSNALAFPIGTVNNYYRVIYGYYKTSKAARNAIDNFPYILRKNSPYVSKIKTNQKKFESYNNRKLEKEINRVEEIQFMIQE